MSSTTSSSRTEEAGGRGRPAEEDPRPRRPFRLLVTNTSASWGGNEAFALQAARTMAARGHDVLFLWSHDVVGARVKEAGVAQARLRLRNDLDLAGVWRLARALAAHRTDVVLLTRWREYLLGGMAARVKRAGRAGGGAGPGPRVVLRLGLRVQPRDDAKRRLVFRLADAVIVNAEAARASLVEQPWIAPGAVRVLHNGIDLERFHPAPAPLGAPSTSTRAEDGGAPAARDAFRREHAIADDALLVGTVGALTPQKDHPTFLAAAARVAERIPGARFVILGEGFLRDLLERDVSRLGLADRVFLPGFRRDVRPALAAFDLFVLSSDNEGMARALLEAMACGLPVVATDVSGTREAVEDGVNGRVVPPRNAEALADAVVELLSDGAARRHAMGAASRRIAEERFDEERMIAELESLLAPIGFSTPATSGTSPAAGLRLAPPRGRRFVLLDEGVTNQHLLKPHGMIPYTMRKRFGYDARIVTLEQGPLPYLEREVEGLPVERLAPFPSRRSALPLLLHLLRHAHDIDVLMVYNVKKRPIHYGLLYKALNPRGFLYAKADTAWDRFGFYADGAFPPYAWYIRRAGARFLRLCDAVSVETRHSFDGQRQVPREKMLFVPGGFDRDLLARLGVQPRPFEEKENLVLQVGRPGDPAKNSELLLEAFAAAMEETWRLALVGPVTTAFLRFADSVFRRHPGLAERVEIPGAVEDKRRLFDYYDRARVFALTSRTESFANVLAEAQAFGCVVVGSGHLPCVRDVTAGETRGRTYAAGEADALAGRLAELAADEARLRSLHEATVAYAREETDWGRILEPLHRLIELKTR